ncbi:MAG TPA: D-TA family PLP-dependent enzyme [Cyclobacteriaceae bacterium]|nr:D-TA family PLP-dependent enzyme [Cyclobacteriaceae bacterium]
MEEAWYTVENMDEIDTPSLVIYLDRVQKNIDVLKSYVSDTSLLRPHVKTHKSLNVTSLLLEAGIEKFKCATIAEAEMLAQAGAPDALLAYQPVGPKAERLAHLIERYPTTTFSCLVDDEQVADHLNEVMESIHHCIPVYIDLNVGMNRTGIKPGPKAIDLYLVLSKKDGILPMGLHAYDGHIRDTDLAERTRRCDDAFNEVLEMKKELMAKGMEEPIIIAGGSPTFPIHARRKDVECSPGTFIYWDKGYHDMLPEQPFEYAALVFTRVISKPSDDIVCIDLGHKSIASENPLNKRIEFLNVDDLEPVGHSEEHMVLKVNGNKLKVGDVLVGVPYHICPTCALYDTAVVVTHHKVVDRWAVTSRNRKLTV